MYISYPMLAVLAMKIRMIPADKLVLTKLLIVQMAS